MDARRSVARQHNGRPASLVQAAPREQALLSFDTLAQLVGSPAGVGAPSQLLALCAPSNKVVHRLGHHLAPAVEGFAGQGTASRVQYLFLYVQWPVSAAGSRPTCPLRLGEWCCECLTDRHAAACRYCMCEFASAARLQHGTRTAPRLYKQHVYDMLRRAACVLGVASATWQAVLALWLLDAALDGSTTRGASSSADDHPRLTCAWAVQVLVGRDVDFPDPAQAVFVLTRLLHCEANALAAAYLDHARAVLAESPQYVVRCTRELRVPAACADGMLLRAGRYGCRSPRGW